MRVIHVLVPRDKLYIVRTFLEGVDVKPFVLCAEDSCLLVINVSDEKAEELSDGLQRIGLGTAFGTFAVLEAKHIPLPLEDLTAQQRAVTKRVAREELLEKISEQATLSYNYVLMTALASILAAAGLLANNVILVIASMLISPLMGPVMGTSLGVVLNREDLLRKSIISEAVGMIVSIIAGLLIALIEPHPVMTEQIALRAYPSVYDVIFALVAGFAAALSTVSLEVMALVGVAIAASLLPPAVNVGIGIAFILRGLPNGVQVTLGSLILLLINIFAIAIISMLFFWFVGVRPGESIRKLTVARRGLRKRFAILVLLFLLATAPVVLSSLRTYQVRKMEYAIKEEAVSYLHRNFPNVTIIDISVSYYPDIRSCEIFLSAGLPELALAKEIARGLAEHIRRTFDVGATVYINPYVYQPSY